MINDSIILSENDSINGWGVIAFNRKGSSNSAEKHISQKSLSILFTNHLALKLLKGPFNCLILIESLKISFLDSIKYFLLRI